MDEAVRRFNVKTVDAKTALFLVERLWVRVCEERDAGEPAEARARRAQRLLLHWWSLGHDPEWHILVCDSCDGRGWVAADSAARAWHGCDDCECGGQKDRKL